MQNVNSHVHSNAPIETEMSYDNLDSIGGFKSCDRLQFCIGELVDYRKCTPSIVHIHQHVLSLLFSHCVPQYGWTALMSASDSGHTDVVHALLSGGAQVDLQRGVSTVYL